MFKTFEDFIQRAVQNYHLPFAVAQGFIERKLRQVNLSPIDVVCYINWADNDCLTYRQLGKKLNISFQAAHQHVQKIKQVWPYLFNFGPKIPQFHHRRSCRGRTMGRLRADVSNEIENF